MKKKVKKITNYFLDNKYKIVSVILLLIFFTYLYFQINLLVTYDGAYYHSYLGYFNGLYPFSNWDAVRGPGFPLILLIIIKLFGDTGFGVLFGLYLFEISFIILSYYVIKRVLNENNYDVPNYIKVLFILLIILNPYIVGYSHSLLTESIIPLFYILVGIICLNIYKLKYKDDKNKYLIESTLLCLLSVIIYLIKQPYAPAAWMAIFITAILSGIYFKSIRVFFSKSLIFVIAIVMTIVSVNGWNLFLKANGKIDEKTTTGLISGFTNGMPYHFKKQQLDDYCSDNILNYYKFNEEDSNKISELILESNDNTSWCSFVDIYNVYDLEMNYIESDALFKPKGYITIGETIKYLLRMYINHPILSFHSYYKNYLAIVDLVNVTDIFSDYTPNGGITYDVSRENDGIAMSIYFVGVSNVFWNHQENYVFPEHFPGYPPDTMKDYVNVTTNNSHVSTLFKLVEPLAKFTFKFLMSCSLLFFIYGLINYIKHGKKQIYFVMILFSGMAVVSTVFNALYAANIDRYIYANYTLMLIVLLLTLINKKDLLKEVKK